MEHEDILSVQTTKGELRYYRDWENLEGGISMVNPVTLKRYWEIKNSHPNADECGVFFAFSNRQFDEGYKRLIELGHIKNGDKVCQDRSTGLSAQRRDWISSSTSTMKGTNG